ncbi:uncharacterized protein VICG_01151 [Vittaforma corneae ATCC 50505]|uniref:Uncharacterized protein n=1 Tax=Vittaforma corneae (strain ATCC 50505) TaxID=993615 RepID=L2GMD5_VITCO|nr:uncharacterized protein VICG_01151 [Vittaforma corneae ATCC 50505]ELA41799.1 hypothetical protein VICG_01151 [Vittaforma corneae ATCC 50505]
MYIYEDFKRILDTTTNLMNKIKTCSKDEIEEIQMRIDSNIHALRLMASRIEDSETRATFLKTIQSLSTNVVFVESEGPQRRRKQRENAGGDELVGDELLKNSRKLKEMADEFKNSLQADRKIIEKLGGKMNASSQESTKSLQALDKTGRKIKSSTFMSFAFMIFVVVYFIIRFL